MCIKKEQYKNKAFLFFVVSILFSCHSQALQPEYINVVSDRDSIKKYASVNKKEVTLTEKKLLPSLVGIQKDIEMAEYLAFKNNNLDAFDKLEKRILAVDDSKAKALVYHKAYWKAYFYYTKSIAMMRAGNNLSAKAPLEKAINILQSMKNRGSEANALLGISAGLNLQYVPKQDIFIAINLVNSSIDDALDQDKNNIRALYAKAISDFYTPREYGGGQRTENLLNKIFTQASPGESALTPTWGYDDSLALKMSVHLEKNEISEAKKMFLDAIHQFPTSVAILEMEKPVNKQKETATN